MRSCPIPPGSHHLLLLNPNGNVERRGPTRTLSLQKTHRAMQAMQSVLHLTRDLLKRLAVLPPGILTLTAIKRASGSTSMNGEMRCSINLLLLHSGHLRSLAYLRGGSLGSLCLATTTVTCRGQASREMAQASQIYTWVPLSSIRQNCCSLHSSLLPRRPHGPRVAPNDETSET